jgi:eukaryotic-like serine/threonine-protein kinase
MHTSKIILVSMITAAITSAAILAGFMGLPYLLGNLPASRDNVQVPSLLALKPDQARMLLDPMGLSLVISEQTDDEKVEAGSIAQQNPMQGSWVKRGTSVQVVISSGLSKLQVPGLTSVSLDEAMQKLTSLGLRLGTITHQKNDSVGANHVIASVPVAGEAVAPNSTVNLIVSDGKQTKVPNIIGKGLTQAKDQLVRQGFVVGNVTYSYDEDHRPGVVLRQDPAGDAFAEEGATIHLVINQSD